MNKITLYSAIEDQKELHQIIATCQPENEASWNLAEKGS